MKSLAISKFLFLFLIPLQARAQAPKEANQISDLPDGIKAEALYPIETRTDEKTGVKLQGIYEEKADALVLVGTTEHRYDERVLKFEMKKKGTYLYRLLMKKQTLTKKDTLCKSQAADVDTETFAVGEEVMSNPNLISAKGAKDAEIRFVFSAPASAIDLRNLPAPNTDCPIMSKTERARYLFLAPPATAWRKISIKTAETMTFRYPIDHAELTLETGPKGVFPLDPSTFELVYVGDAL